MSAMEYGWGAEEWVANSVEGDSFLGGNKCGKISQTWVGSSSIAYKQGTEEGRG